MRLVSWNVNGFRSVLKKGFLDWLREDRPDVLCLQETRVRPEQIPAEAEQALRELGYHGRWSPAERPGYSGSATLALERPAAADSGLGSLSPKLKHWDTEGRVTVSRHGNLLLLNVYFPNGTSGDERLRYKLDFYEDFQALCERLQKKGENLVICGDLNTAHREIDLARPRENRTNSGFLPIECAWVDRFLKGAKGPGFIDTFRRLHPEERGAYSWWSFRSGARSRNVGWRLDYFFICPGLMPRLRGASILRDVPGSDHCPVELVLDS